MKSNSRHIIIITLITVFCSAFSFAQYNGKADFETAAILFSEYGKNKALLGKLDSAYTLMERSFSDEKISSTATANNYSGAIFKELYKTREADNASSSFRKMAFDRFIHSWNLDTSRKNRDIVKPQLKWIAGQYNNDAKRSLESNTDVESAQKNFSEFKKIYLIIDPAFNVKGKEIEFELACGSALQEKAEKLGKKEFYDLAKVSYLKVLDLDTANNDANYNMGIIYYNQGAFLIMKVLDFDTPLDSISIIEDMAKKLFIQAKPFMHKANFEKPNCLKILEGLMGIYYSLNDEDNFKRYKALFEKLKSDIESGILKEDC